MAVTKLWAVKTNLGKVIDYANNPNKTRNPKYTEEQYQALADVLTYAKDEEKTEKQFFVDGINCNPSTARDQFITTKEYFGKTDGIQAYHGYMSFKEQDITPEKAQEVGMEFARRAWGKRFQVVVTCHLNTQHLHCHFVINSISFVDGKRMVDNEKNWFKFRHIADAVCKEYGLHFNPNPKFERPTNYYFDKLEKAGMPNRYQLIRDAINHALEHSKSVAEVGYALRDMGYGYDFNPRRKYWTVKPPGYTKSIRLNRVGDDYTREAKARKNGYRQPQRSPEEYKQFKKEEKEAVYQLVDSAVANVVSSPTEFQKFLDTQARMDRYSAANALLIYKQCPEATQLKDFDGWREENVRIKKGAKSISILEPVDYTRADGTQGISYNVKKVFDVTQTNGRRKPAPTVNRDPRNLVTVMINTSPVNCESAEQLPNPDAVAYYDNSKDTLFIKKGVGDSVALFQGVALELGYAELSSRSESFSRKDMSFQAVCVGYMLCKKYGVDTKSFAVDRVPAEWKDKEPKDVRAELSKVRTAMSDIHSRISDELYRQQQERTADRAR